MKGLDYCQLQSALCACIFNLEYELWGLGLGTNFRLFVLDLKVFNCLVPCLDDAARPLPDRKVLSYWRDDWRFPVSCSLARVELGGGLVLRRTRLGWWLRRQWIECQEDCRLRSASDRLSSASESSSYDWLPPPGSHLADCRTTVVPTRHHRPRYIRPNVAKDEAEIQTEVKHPTPRMRPTMRPT